MLLKSRRTRKTVFVILCIVVAIGMLVSFISAAASILADRNFYLKPVSNQNYIDSVRQNMVSDLETLCLMAEIPSESVMGLVNDAQLEAMSAEYIRNVQDYVTGRTDSLTQVEVDPGLFSAAVAEYDYGDMLAEDLADTVRISVMPVDEGVMLTYAQKVVVRVAPIVRFVSRMLPAAVIITFFGLCGAIWLGRRHSNRIYGLAGTVWCISTLIAIPVWVFGGHPWMERIVLEDSPLKIWLTCAYDSLVGKLTVLSSILFAVCTLCLFGAVVRVAHERRRYELHKERKRLALEAAEAEETTVEAADEEPKEEPEAEEDETDKEAAEKTSEETDENKAEAFEKADSDDE